MTEQTSRSSAQKIDARFSRYCKNTNLFIECLEKDKDTDKDVDADRHRTGRPAGGHLSPQLEEMIIDFRVSGSQHAVVKQAENVRARELVKKIESDPHRQALQSDPQQNNAHNPLSEKSKNKDMGNVEFFAKQFLKCNAKIFFTGIRTSFTALAGIPRERINPEVSSDRHWIFSQSRTMSLRKGDRMTIFMGRLTNKDNTILSIIRERDASREDLKELLTVSKKIPYFVNLKSALIDLKKSASRWRQGRTERFHLSNDGR